MLASICMLISAVSFSLMAVLINFSYRDKIAISQLIVVRAIIMGIFCVGWLKLHRHPLLGPKDLRRYIYIRAAVSGTAIAFGWYAFVLIDNGDAVALISTFPVMCTVGAYIFLHEKIGWLSAAAVCLTIVGSTLICRPQFLFPRQSSNRPGTLGVVLALCCAFFHAVDFLVIKRARDSSPLVLVFACSIGAGVAGILTAFIFVGWDVFPSFSKVGLMVCTGFLGFTGQIFGVLGTQNIAVRSAAILKSSETVFGYIFQVVFLSEPKPNLLVIIGVVSVISAVILSTFESSKKPGLKHNAYKCCSKSTDQMNERVPLLEGASIGRLAVEKSGESC